MENRMRDLDRIQEHDGEDRSRRLGTILLATAAVVGLTFALGVVVGEAAETEAQDIKDPLAQLDQAALGVSAPALDIARKAPRVEAADLSFPSTLREEEERPEVLAALQAAAREEEALAEPEAPSEFSTDNDVATPAPSPPEPDDPEPDFADDLDAERIAASVPAAFAAGSAGEELPKVIKHDPLVARAIANEEEPEESRRAPRGSDGEYTLQVISYDSPEPARAFAEGLRSRGHQAFVTQADIPDRGRYYRVRIGPFDNRFKAETYRRKFEEEERMNTFVVRKRED